MYFQLRCKVGIDHFEKTIREKVNVGDLEEIKYEI